MERFWSKVNVKAADECWIWKNETSYGCRYPQFRYPNATRKSKRYRAHRVAWILTHGKIPHGQYVLHRCDNMRCVNPSHLFLGTRADNIADMVRKERQKSILKASDVLIIRSRLKTKERQKDIAMDFGVSQSCISAIKNRYNWKHI